MKSYDEIANSVFERREKYIANKKRNKRIILSIVTPTLCCIVLITSFGFLNGGFFSNNIPVKNSSDSNSSTQDNISSTKPLDDTSSQGDVISDNSSSIHSYDKTPSKPSDNTSSKHSDESGGNTANVLSPDCGKNYFIDSIDKINFYSAKKIISDNSLSPMGLGVNNSRTQKIHLLNNNYTKYTIDRSKVFTTTSVTYFTIELNDKKGFLAKKLGGTGLVEVVITENNIDDLGQMITFKRGKNYYTCLKNGGDYDPDSNKSSHEFSSHKFVKGFYVIKNLEQENYKFTVHYDGSKVTGFECAPFDSVPTKYAVDDVTFIEDFCVVLYTKQTFTIDELEIYFKNDDEMDSF